MNKERGFLKTLILAKKRSEHWTSCLFRCILNNQAKERCLTNKIRF